MANKNNRNRQLPNNRPVPDPKNDLPEEPVTKSISLRLPEKLHETARLCSESCGIPLNGLICVALTDYLSSRGYKVHPVR